MRAKKIRSHFDVWPAYVDILATVLMVIIFILMTFVLAQIYLSESIVSKDSAIENLTAKVCSLDQNLDAEKQRLKKMHTKLAQIETDLQLEHNLNKALNDDKANLSSRLEAMMSDLKKVTDLLDVETQTNKRDQITIEDLSRGIDKLSEELALLKQTNTTLQAENEQHKELTRVHAYRSEFFTKLKAAIGDIEDMRVVGDRFVFQSELLFAPGATDLGEEGKEKLNHLSRTLKDIAKKIPKNINWVLRVDGHTDNIPIRHAFASNWELSTARAISVVKYLIKQGIDPKNLVAAGFGEFQPLDQDKSLDGLAKNRRIEFKLDQR
ncbi:MAG: peptidoglycan-binding protein [Alphaproteobacteria bacterium]|nr:peptidoglycan-binding protein [Alphaproteobacteria bacterium]